MSVSTSFRHALGEAPSARAARWLAVGAVSSFCVLVLVACQLWRTDFARGWDMPVYAGYGERITDGEVPYRDFHLEYPPGVLPLFALPALDAVSGTGDTGRVWEPVDEISDSAWRYARAFIVLTTLLGIAAIVATSASLAALRRPLGDRLLALGTLALSPLLLGGLVYTRYDLLPAAAVAVALALVLRGRDLAGGVATGIAITAKLYPVVLVPLLVAHAWRARGRRQAMLGLAAVVATVAIVLAPFVVASPSGVWTSVRTQVTRGLQAESTPAAALVAVSRAAWKAGLVDDLPLRVDEGEPGGLVSAQLEGKGVGLVGALSSLAVLGALAGVWWRGIRRDTDPDELVRLVAIAVVALVALGKVLSPQFLVWLVPLVPLVGGLRGRVATIALALAMVVTHVWFPDVYRDYVNLLDAGSTAVLLARNALLLVVLGALVWPCRARVRSGT